MSHKAQEYVKKMRERGGENFFSSLEQVRQRANMELEACAKDEKRTREYLHRAKLHCSLVLQRRKEKNVLLGGASGSRRGTPSGRSSPTTPSVHSSTTRPVTVEQGSLRGWRSTGDAAGSAHGDDDNAGSHAGSTGSSRRAPAAPAPRLLPPRNAEAFGGSDDDDGASKKAVNLPRGPPNTLKQDRKALEAIAKQEGPVDFEYKIPPGATWSEHVSTMSREWCDFVLNKPNRIWDWDSKLEQICEQVVGGMDELEQENIFKEMLASDKRELNGLSSKMLTMADVQAKKRQRRFAKACEESLEKMFEDIALKVAAMSTAGASMGIDVSLLKAKPMDMREFALLLAHLDIVPARISKTEAQHLFMETKEEMSKSSSKDLGYQHFKV